MQSQTRSGKGYTACNCPSSFSLAHALQRAVEDEDSYAQYDTHSDYTHPPTDRGLFPKTPIYQPFAIHANINDFPARTTRSRTKTIDSGMPEAGPLTDGGLSYPSNAAAIPGTAATSSGSYRKIIDTPTPAPTTHSAASSPRKRKAEANTDEAIIPTRRVRTQEVPDPDTSTRPSPMQGNPDSTAMGDDDASKDEQKEPKGWKARRKERRKEYEKEKKRKRKHEAFVKNTSAPRPEDVSARVSNASTIPVNIKIEQLPSNVGGYESRKEGAAEAKPELLNLEELKVNGFTEIEWDSQEPLLIIHPETKELIGIGVGKPPDQTYDNSVKAVHELFLHLGQTEDWEEKYVDHKRGKDWPAVNMGMASGFGNEPYNQRNNHHEHVVEELRANPHLQRLAVHQSESFKFYLPRLYSHYHERTIPFRKKHPGLVVNWEHSIFCSAACNLGPHVATFLHRDCMNLSFGFCAVHALGNYDHTKGGHLVLKELKLIIQFPPGALILLPSAVITHGNIPVQTGETRTSFTQYTAGAVFRYVDNGYRTEEKFKKRDKKGYAKMVEEKPTKWKTGLSLWSTVDELLQRTKPCIGSAGATSV